MKHYYFFDKDNQGNSNPKFSLNIYVIRMIDA